MIRITSRKEGFRRCGVAHPAQSTDHPVGRFTEKQIEILKADPMLIVEELLVVAEGKGAAPARPNAEATIALVEAAETIEALDTMAVGEARKTVLAAQSTDHPVGRFTEKQIEILKADPMLIVEELLVVAEGKGAAPARPNAEATIALVEAAETIEALDTMAVGEARKTVLAAIEARRKELEA